MIIQIQLLGFKKKLNLSRLADFSHCFGEANQPGDVAFFLPLRHDKLPSCSDTRMMAWANNLPALREWR